MGADSGVVERCPRERDIDETGPQARGRVGEVGFAADTDVSGTRWIEVVRHLAAEDPRVVVPGHGDIGGPQLLADVRDYLLSLREETWLRRDSAMSEETITEEVRAVMIERHPQWAGREWIEKGVGCLCAEHS
ncbi:hypothetical protein ACH4U7_09000 [Streptomyces sp. NPDC020845]|uniref:hypothetical protein n=1 Tax=Streptomyces sp. NPDC020845 TaxID=3365096 RepID=UPI0037AC5855